MMMTYYNYYIILFLQTPKEKNIVENKFYY